MRAPRLALACAAALLGGGCTHLAPFQPTEAAQRVADDRALAAAEVGGVRLTVRAGEWDGWPSDLTAVLTPVEVLVENHSGQEVDLRPGDLTLVVPGGTRYQPLGPREVRERLRPSRGWYGGPYYAGAFGWYPWPSYYRPWPRWYPYVWYGGPVGPPPGDAPVPSPRASLLDGGQASLLLFYPVPAEQLPALTLEARLFTVGKAPLGTVKVPLARAPSPAAPPAQPAP
jgi:hypothetical protein